ncbi:hypothetical protein RSOLAG22IIIB_00307 [Rhizoctonia solani]|uniref:Uncharacterized protein n=1 Tax=Rhizoctonia solani TaxID=456999 RepID=A0A0K6FL37_9AGAM|nr:hypothetical protein RSOLAG22IIIB_00307 [Rhizoctonia solani]
MSLLLYATPSFLFVTICPATIVLFTLRRVSGSSNSSSSIKTTDFYATLLFGIFMTIAGVFGLVAESLASSDSRWWASAAFAMQALGILIAQLAVIQLLTPDYLFNLLLIDSSTHMLPSWRIYTLIIISLLASIISIISAFVVPHAPNLPSSIATLVSLSLPIPFLFSLARLVTFVQSGACVGPSATTHTEQNSKCTDLEFSATSDPSSTTPRYHRVWGGAFALQTIAVASVAGQVAEGALGYRVPILRLLSALGLITWGGGVMIIHFVIIYDPTHRCPLPSSAISKPPHDLERASNQPSEDFMNLKDPFASPTQAGFPLQPSPPRNAPRRKPRRRASEPLRLKRFGSFAVLTEDVKEKQAGTEEDQHTQFLEELVRHAWFSAGHTDSDSMRNNAHERGETPSTPAQVKGDVFTSVSPGLSGNSTPIGKKELPGGPEEVSPSILKLHTFRPVTPPRPAYPSPWTSHRRLDFPEPPTSFPLSSPSLVASACSLPSVYPSAYMAPPSPGSSESGSSFISPPPTPTPGPLRRYSRQNALALAPIKPRASLGSPSQYRRTVGPRR